jgi:hypothetical protein
MRIQGKAKQVKSRTHVVLFVKDTPFKLKIVKDRTKYDRKPKHRKMHDC